MEDRPLWNPRRDEGPRLLSEDEVEEIRRGMREGLHGPVVRMWVERLLRDRDARVRRERSQE